MNIIHIVALHFCNEFNYIYVSNTKNTNMGLTFVKIVWFWREKTLQEVVLLDGDSNRQDEKYEVISKKLKSFMLSPITRLND